ncbi:MAG: ATP-binding protein [Leptolyngbyaceae cyanobacterium RU_5_1]|nr:ATP-binding protein [Leptolyngbyaceae cyanobacterium RU_5_1]
MSIEEALAAIEQVLERGRLSKVEGIVVRQCWEGRSYLEIAQAFGYDAGYIKDTGYRLWKCLSEACGEKVTKQNFKGVLKRFIQHQAASALEHQHSTAASASPRRDLPFAIAHNLPVRDFSELIGRDRELAQLLEILSFDRPMHCISIEGIGGMGKTTLALAAAYHSLQLPQPSAMPKTELLQTQPAFDAIIFTSAKQERLTPQGVLPRLRSERNLQDVFRAIARTLNRSDLLLMDFENQLQHIQDSLSRQSTLLIIDNLETLADWDLILAFLYDLPATVKVVITSRQQSSFAAIRLEPLAASESLDLIQQQARQRGLPQFSGCANPAPLHEWCSGGHCLRDRAIGGWLSGQPSRFAINAGSR